MFRTTSELVVVQAVVFSSDPGPVTELTAADFRITEEGNDRPISLFIPPDSGPLDLALVVDASGSMERWPTREATRALIDSLDPESCVLLLPFANHVRRGVWGRAQDPRLQAAIDRLELVRGTALYDALRTAFRMMRTRASRQATPHRLYGPENESPTFEELMRYRLPGTQGQVVETEGSCTIEPDPQAFPDRSASVRRVIAVISDGHDNESLGTLDDVLLSAWGSNLPVFAFTATERSRGGSLAVRGTPARFGHVRALEKLAEHTGGLVIRETMDDIGPPSQRSMAPFWDGYEQLGAALRGHYVLGYVPETTNGATLLADRRSIRVSVRRPGFDVLAPRNLVLGQGASEGAAFDLGLRGFQELEAGALEEALETFTNAASLAPGLGLAAYGRGMALRGLEEWDKALAAFRTAKTLAPWIPDVHARIAELLIETGEPDVAWAHVLRAHAEGSEVLELAERLQVLVPRQLDLGRRPRSRRIRLKMSGGLIVGLFARPVLASLATAVEESDSLALSGGRDADIVLVLEVTKAQVRGPRMAAHGWLRLENEAGALLKSTAGETLLSRRFSLKDVSTELQSLSSAVVLEIEQALDQ